jgi:hypothetical protein
MVYTRKNITTEERTTMMALRERGKTLREIAKATGRTYNGVRLALDPVAREKGRLATAARRAKAKAEDLEGFLAKGREAHRKYHQSRPELRMLYSARESAKRQDIPFDLVADDIIIPERCPVLGLELQRSNGSRTYSSPSLDRLVPLLGYVKGNVQVISWRANKLKGEGTAEEHRLISQWMEENGAA